MNQKDFSFIAGMIFAIITILHLVRIAYGWNAVINDWSVPMWLSWITIIVAGCLAYQGLKLGKK